MSDEPTGFEPALSQGITGKEPQLGGPCADGRSWEQLSRDERHDSVIKICQKCDFCLDEISQELIGSGVSVASVTDLGGIVNLQFWDGDELISLLCSLLPA